MNTSKKISKNDHNEPKKPEEKTFENLQKYLKDYGNYKKLLTKAV